MPYVFTIFATGQTEREPEVIETVVRTALASVGVELIPCNWAPDADTIADACELADDKRVTLIDLN